MIPIANPDIGAEEKEQVEAVLDSGMLADGPVVRDFEEEFAAYCGVDHGVATSNGTTALHTAFQAMGIGDGDRVITTPFSFIASANAIKLAGAEPVFADIDPETYNLDPEAVESRIEEYDGEIDAILAVHLYGLPADMPRLRDIADAHEAALIEDAAQAHGARIDGQRVGWFGDVACFSFYPTKNMTTGEGGMVVTDSEAVADRGAQFVNHGRTDTYEHATVGHNFRMTSIAAAIGNAQLEKLPDYIEARRNNAAALTEGLEDTSIVTPTEPSGRTHAYHQYTIRCDDRAAMKAHLDEHDIGYGVYYPQCIHQQEAYHSYSVSAPVAESAAKEVLSIPIHPSVSSADIQHMIQTLSKYES